MSDNKFETIEQRVSYGVGRQLGDQLRSNPFKDFDITAVQAGIADALVNADSQVSDEDLIGEQSGISMLTLHIEIIASEACEGDINGDGEVNVEDLLILIGAWGGDDPAADLDANGTVGVSDLLLLIAAWGDC